MPRAVQATRPCQVRLRLVSASVVPLAFGPKLDVCLAQHVKEEINDLRSELRAITNEILSMPEDESSLADRAASTCIKKGLSGQGLAIKRLLHDQASSPKLEKASISEEGSMKIHVHCIYMYM